MALRGCSHGLVVTALVTLLLLPAQYFVPELYVGPDEPPEPRAPPAPPPSAARHWLLDFPVLDLIVTVFLFICAVMTYLFDWIQRKLMERRVWKLNQHLYGCAARLRAWDARQEQLEAALRMAQVATSEYNLLLYLLLRRRQPRPGWGADDCALLAKRPLASAL
ncbi:uncharacterized protein LOC112046121 [Bicyclus anynana]|uniref:Uncharacterized protein LOC112046121 n=1 Tax=Bicyclus anynana TaxID=110368 RepID=A0A6J1MV16_BICAN|nr:uncharacterized protein LOC112046121 [Bicyclus anynana]